MKSKISEDSQRFLMLVKLDAQRVFERIKFRAPEYMTIFSLKRTRDHFVDIFRNRYDAVTIKELMLCGPEVIVGLDQFYTKLDEIRWYLNHTQDMPTKVEDKMRFHIRELEKHYQTLDLYINVEMGIASNPVEEQSDAPSFEEVNSDLISEENNEQTDS